MKHEKTHNRNQDTHTAISHLCTHTTGYAQTRRHRREKLPVPTPLTALDTAVTECDVTALPSSRN